MRPLPAVRRRFSATANRDRESSNIDFRITRDIPIHEKISMQIIGEAFNLFNHDIISATNTTFSTRAVAGSRRLPGRCQR